MENPSLSDKEKSLEEREARDINEEIAVMEREEGKAFALSLSMMEADTENDQMRIYEEMISEKADGVKDPIKTTASCDSLNSKNTTMMGRKSICRRFICPIKTTASCDSLASSVSTEDSTNPSTRSLDSNLSAQAEDSDLSAQADEVVAMAGPDVTCLVFKTLLSDASYSPWTGLILRKERGLPKISKDEVLIKVEASSLSTRDCLERLRRNNNLELQDEFWVPGHEIVGRVVRAGKRTNFLMNKRVAALLPNGGGNAQYVRVHIDGLISVPEQAKPQDLIYLLSTYLPAYQCLNREIEVNQSTCCVEQTLKPSDLDDSDNEIRRIIAGRRRSPLYGKNVLISGAGSPVGLALIDVARNAGASVYALSQRQNERAVTTIGVKGCYPLFQKESWTKSWRGKMDIIVDTVGDYDNYTAFYDVMTFCGGRFVRMNTTSCEEKYVPVLSGMQCDDEEFFSLLKYYKGSRINKMAVDYNIFDSFDEEKEFFTEDLAYLHHLVQMGRIKRRVFSHVGFDKLEREWMRVMDGRSDGGVVTVSPFKGCETTEAKIVRVKIHHDLDTCVEMFI